MLKEIEEDIKKAYVNSLLSLAVGRYILNASPLAFGLVDFQFSFTEDKLVVIDRKEEQIFEIYYDKNTISFDEFEKQVVIDEELADRNSYKNIVRYDLCESTKDLPGYSLYILNDSIYWMATLYNNNIWRVIEMDSSYWTSK